MKLIDRQEYKEALIEELNDYLCDRYSGTQITYQLTGEIEAVLMDWAQFHYHTLSSRDLTINYDMLYPRVQLKELGS